MVHKTEANDQWAFYQAKKIREHNEEIGAGLLNALAPDPAKVAALSTALGQEKARYAREAEAIQRTAQERDQQAQRSESRALRFDVGEGFLELGLIMSSLYFLSRRRFFVAFGAVAAAVGTVVSVIGFYEFIARTRSGAIHLPTQSQHLARVRHRDAHELAAGLAVPARRDHDPDLVAGPEGFAGPAIACHRCD